ncbi:hypothetical protein MKZ87_13895 [Pseudomonas sp. MCal1]|nr:hypothetical protein [Pseudomonas sp. MCal1]MCX4218732.1 hypothetical protein [Pseudomonas sp. MCal1]
MSSLIIMWKAMKNREEEKRVINARKLEARVLPGGCVLILFPRSRT